MQQTASAISSDALYEARVNPQWVRLLDILEMNVHYERRLGAELLTSGGRCIPDFLSGYRVHDTGHSHAEIIAALKKERDRAGDLLRGLAGEFPENRLYARELTRIQ